nr:DUF6159 family protein [uncultured Methanoregula sp.]
MMKTAPAVLSTPPATVHPLEPDGGAGGAGRIGRGAGIVADSIKTLVRNRQLLWFSVLTGIVIAFMFIAQYTLHVLGSYPYEMINSSLWPILTFIIELVSVFCLCFLLAGLVLNRSSDPRGKAGSFRQGLSKAKDHLRPILIWSGIMAILGTGVYFLIQSTGDLTITSLIIRFPFGYIMEPEAYGPGPIAGGFHIMYAAGSTFLMMVINVILLVLTLFVIPVLALEKKSLSYALGESARLVRQCWGEILVCFFILGIIFIAFTLLSGVFQIIFSAVELNGQFWYEFYYMRGWAAVALVYMAAWTVLVLIGATLAGIAIQNLYQYAKTGMMPGAPEGIPEVQTSD